MAVGLNKLVNPKYMPTAIASGEPNRIADRLHIVVHSDHIYKTDFSLCDALLSNIVV